MAKLTVGPLMFGGASIGGLYAPVTEQEARATLVAAWDAGIRAFDTAPHYGVGLSERRIGEFLAGRPRPQFVVSTKVGRRLVRAAVPVAGVHDFHGTPELSRVRDYSRDGVLRALEDSMGRLRLDYLDIVLIHDPDDYLIQALDEAAPALAELRAQGVVGAIGAGMNSADKLAWLTERADFDCVLIANRYNLLDSTADCVLLPLCAARGVSVFAGGVFCTGVLAGGDRFEYVPASAEVRARVARLREACDRYDVPLPAAALRYVLRHPAVTAALVGARSPAEIRADVDYLTVDIPDALWSELAMVP